MLGCVLCVLRVIGRVVCVSNNRTFCVLAVMGCVLYVLTVTGCVMCVLVVIGYVINSDSYDVLCLC